MWKYVFYKSIKAKHNSPKRRGNITERNIIQNLPRMDERVKTSKVQYVTQTLLFVTLKK